MSEDVASLKAELQEVREQLVSVSEHRSRVMVSLTERSHEVTTLISELNRAKAESCRHLEEMSSTAKNLKLASGRASELLALKNRLQTEYSQLTDELETTRWDLASARGSTADAELRASQSAAELAKIRLELDSVRRTLEAKADGWKQEREQLDMTVTGLSLELQNEHVAARQLHRLWLTSSAGLENRQPGLELATRSVTSSPGFDARDAQFQALQRELEELRSEKADLALSVRELKREAARACELERSQQDYRQLQVEHQLLKRKLEDVAEHDEEREALREQLTELRATVRDAEGLRAEVERLRAKLYKAPLNSGTFPLGEKVDAIARGEVPARDLAAELADFAHQTEAESAVVADSLGFPVAAIGASGQGDSLAAVAGDADRLRTQARQLLGLAEVTQLTVEDREGRFAVFRYFEVDGNLMSIGMLTPRNPEPHELERFLGVTRHALSVPRIRAERGPEAPPRRSGRAAANIGGSPLGLAGAALAKR